MTPEGKVKHNIKLVLKKYTPRVWYFMPIHTGFGVHGIPDFVICAGGKFLGVETKAGNGKVTLYQQMQLGKIAEAGGYTMVLREDNVDEFEVKLIRILEGME